VLFPVGRCDWRQHTWHYSGFNAYSSRWEYRLRLADPSADHTAGNADPDHAASHTIADSIAHDPAGHTIANTDSHDPAGHTIADPDAHKAARHADTDSTFGRGYTQADGLQWDANRECSMQSTRYGRWSWQWPAERRAEWWRAGARYGCAVLVGDYRWRRDSRPADSSRAWSLSAR
jgi:hypothetical protein